MQEIYYEDRKEALEQRITRYQSYVEKFIEKREEHQDEQNEL